MAQIKVTFEQAKKYFENRLGRTLPSHNSVLTLCPLHQDGVPSLSIQLGKGGVWKCHSGADCGKGGILAFERKMFPESADQACQRVNEVMGSQVFSGEDLQLVAQHLYLSPRGVPLFRKRRYLRPDGKKTFVVSHMNKSGEWEKGIGNVTPVLYNLPEVVTASVVIVGEGEKVVDAVKEALPEMQSYLGRESLRMAVTTSYDGAAGKWHDHYNPYFAGKIVIVMADNDVSGEEYVNRIASAVYPYAESVYSVSFPEMNPKDDAADFLETHSVEEFAIKFKSPQKWTPKTSGVLVCMSEFVESAQCHYIDWAVDNVIQRGSNGVIGGDAKAGKSFATVDMMLSMAAGISWLGFGVIRPCRVALVSREDNPALTSWRIKSFFRGKCSERGFNPTIVDENFYINSKQQTPELMLENDAQVDELVSEIRNRHIEFCVLDVLNVLHLSDENDPTEMRQVMRRVNQIQDRTGAYMGIVHHYSKHGTGNITKQLRGAGSIGGWVEWMIGISMADHEKKIRMMEFESKAGPPDPIHYMIDNSTQGTLKLTRVDMENEKMQRKKVKVLSPPEERPRHAD